MDFIILFIGLIFGGGIENSFLISFLDDFFKLENYRLMWFGGISNLDLFVKYWGYLNLI